MKRLIAVGLLVVGVAGLLLPILPGTPFVLAGLIKLGIIPKERVLALWERFTGKPAPAFQQ